MSDRESGREDGDKERKPIRRRGFRISPRNERKLSEALIEYGYERKFRNKMRKLAMAKNKFVKSPKTTDNYST